METNFLERLIEARDKLNALRSVRCRMTHERVLIDRDLNLPVAGIAPEMEFKRRNLCDFAQRNANIACSHSMARYAIGDALDALENFDECENWREELNHLNTTIHNLDREKSDAEIEVARTIKKLSETEKTKIESVIAEQILISQNVARIERLHSDCADKIELLKNKISDALDTAIRRETENLSFV